jgi:endonuclease/exonuclease/phosphatase (EEP) superfamily protein YafD
VSPQHTGKTNRRPAPRRLACATSIVALGLGCLGVGAPAPAQAAKHSVTPEVVMVQANIKTGMTVPKFQSDVRAVLAPHPDFVTYNEVPMRQDGVLAPEGYDLWRTPGQYEGATPVAWRTDTWAPIAEGTRRISNYRKIPPKRHTMLGLRYANWVTLQSVDGRVVSVVSAHVAPFVPKMPDLRRRTVAKIGELVSELKAAGPVFVGGDFNVHYTSSAYPRDVLTSDSMVPTYDALGSYFPTGDHQGATIDYVFTTSDEQIQVMDQRAVELNSDHNAVVAGLSWTVDAPADTTRIVNDPAGTSQERRLVLRQVLQAVRTASAGESVDLVTANLQLPRVAKALESAAARGVVVRVITRRKTLTPLEQKLATAIGTSSGSGPGLWQCLDACRATWRAGSGPTTMVLRRADTGVATLRIDVDRRLLSAVTTRHSSAVTSVGRVSLSQAEDLLASLRPSSE